jgi:ribosome biogenesis GTPase
MAKKRKTRVDLRRNRSKPPREQGWTREFQQHGFTDDDSVRQGERVRARGDLSRKRTIITEEAASDQAADGQAPAEMPAINAAECQQGRVIRVHGLQCWVAGADGKSYRCVVRRLLRNLVIDERNILAPGDRVWFLGTGNDEGVVERIEPRHGVLTRESRGKEHVIVANVDQLVIVGSLSEPGLKPHLIDRYLASAFQGRIRPVVCLNKVDLVDPADYQWIVGMYSQLGIPVFLTSAASGQGISGLRALLQGRETVFAGQSGVGKSSLLNVVQPELGLAVGEVSETTEKGKHTTTTTELIQLEFGGWVVDTPGIRQFALWDMIPEELEGFFPEFRPYVPHCRFQDCNHLDAAEGCAIREAVRLHRIALQRYESYVGLYEGRLYE